MKKFFIKNSNGEFSEGDIFDTNANDHTNIRFGSFLGVFIKYVPACKRFGMGSNQHFRRHSSCSHNCCRHFDQGRRSVF